MVISDPFTSDIYGEIALRAEMFQDIVVFAAGRIYAAAEDTLIVEVELLKAGCFIDDFRGF